MRRPLTLLALLITSCAQQPGAEKAAEHVDDSGAALAGASGVSAASGGAGAAAAVRAGPKLRPTGDGNYATPLPRVDRELWLDAEGMAVGAPDEAPHLFLRTLAFGRGGAMTPFADAAPTPGCAALPDTACLPVITRPGAALTEWWAVVENGVEVGWSVPRPPPGAGPLHIELALDGAGRVTVAAATNGGQAGATFTDSEGGWWSVGGVVAYGADGAPLEATLQPVPGGLRVVVDDTGARYPLTIDPLFTTAAQVIGTPTSTATNPNLHAVGDFNGDGFDDLAALDTAEDWTAIYNGAAAGPATTATRTLPGRYPLYIYTADVNGDGYDDLLTLNGSNTATIELRLGSSAGLPVEPDWSFDDSSRINDHTGLAVGDFNADGFDDVLLPASQLAYTTNPLRFDGGPSGLSASPTALSALVGLHWAEGVGDVSCDGVDDLVAWDTIRSRGATLHLGSAAGLNTAAAATWVSTSTATNWSAAISLPDVNGDGCDELVLGRVNTASTSTAGVVYVYAGRAGGPTTTALSTIPGVSAGGNFGLRMRAGDVDGDGRGDLVLDEALTHTLHLGTASGVSALPARTFSTDGNALGLGDLNGDGWLDLTSGGPLAASQVRLGSATGLSTSATALDDRFTGAVTFYGIATSPYPATIGTPEVLATAYQVIGSTGSYYTERYVAEDGYLVPSAAAPTLSNHRALVRGGSADFNGDGVGELWGWRFTVSGSTATSSFTGLVGGTTRWTIPNIFYNTPTLSLDGVSLPTALDFNNDGFDDIAALTTTSWPTVTLRIFLGGASRTGTLTADISSSGVTIGASSTVTPGLITLGDVNGDGFDDLGILANTTLSIFHGRTGTAAITAADTALSDVRLPTALGDINGDGYDDIITLCSSSCGWGRVDLYLGGPRGLTFAQSVSYRSSALDATTTAGDFNGDDVLDLAFASREWSTTDYTLAIFHTEAGLLETTPTTFTTPAVINTFGSALAAADLDGDGADELIVRSTPYSYSVFRGYGDNDGDGVYDYLDCDPADPLVGAAAVSAYVDGDGDGYGAGSATLVCAAGAGTAAVAGDCNDSAATIFPGAPDTPMDGVDSDCDGAELCARDADTDGVRPDATSTVLSADGDCADAGEATAAAPTGDCDDSNSARSPLRAEVADDGIDQDCVAGDLCYIDADDDGQRPTAGGTMVSVDLDCLDPGEARATDPTGDCDDSDATIRSSATELAGDLVDQNCDGRELCYTDVDRDGQRPASGATTLSADADCSDVGEAAASAAATDCDDSRASVYLGAPEVVGDGIDQDCDGFEGCYTDADGDGLRGADLRTIPSTDADCADAGEATAALPATDCDDSDPAIRPGATELPGDLVDQNCDGAELCYADGDRDGARGPGGATVASADLDCADLGEAVASAVVDCDDAAATTYPGAPELPGDGVDQSCDGAELCYADGDRDGARSATLTVASADLDCADPGEAAAAIALDCDDSDAARRPGATELPGDLVDQNCDGAELCYADGDRDGARSATLTVASADLDCADLGEGASTAAEDCDDAVAAIRPGATELPGDAIDQDCDGAELCYADADDDGARPSSGLTVASPDLDCGGPGEATAFDPATDCDDGDATRFVGAPEVVGDGVDQDCNGAERCYADSDGDGQRGTDLRELTSIDLDCADPGEAAAALPATDCDDGVAEVRAGVSEVAGDERDQNCDGLETCFADADSDGFRAPEGTTVSSTDADCRDPGEAWLSVPATDCDDLNPDRNPSAEDLPEDGIDQDCDGVDARDGGTADDGATDDGATDDGAADDGAADDGAADDGTADDGTADDGATDDLGNEDADPATVESGKGQGGCAAAGGAPATPFTAAAALLTLGLALRRRRQG
ncbi:MAG: VCBS repeat-containing protein [Deltaproteobacteria bacterium]|nr:VCBS repeat-containing protein [Deltaproteobacteria bacterium]